MDIKSLASKILCKDFKDVILESSENLCVTKKNGKITVSAPTVPAKMRGLMIAALNENINEYSVSEYPRFNKFGVMLDVSRGGVMRVEKIKEYILRTALCGANMISLYMEDIYTLADYPHLGFMRGAYTDSELKEIVNFADSLGVEVVPAIQTLGHMAQYLSWKNETADIKDTRTVMMAGSEETLKFIESAFSKMAEIFTSKRIHIGMDEAHDVGLGKYLKENGFKDRFEILTDHLNKTVKICEKYGMAPTMWSDMFFRLGSKTGDYYDKNGTFPENIKDFIPKVNLMYWDYYHNGDEHYERMFSRHKMLSDNISFAGAVCTFRGMMPDFNLTFDSTIPALKHCIKHGVKEVWTTMWGDDGTQADYFDALFGFALFGEFCYCGENADVERAKKIGTLISGLTEEVAACMSAAFLNKFTTPLFWGDIFYNTTGVDYSNGFAESHYRSFGDCGDEFTETVLRIMCIKAHIYGKMKKSYDEGDDMRMFSIGVLPILIENLKKAKDLHINRFLSVNKVFGMEVLAARYDAAIGRAEYALRKITDYSNDIIDTIEELEYTALYGDTKGIHYNMSAFGRAVDVSL